MYSFCFSFSLPKVYLLDPFCSDNVGIEGFHVISYRANFASHHTHDCHVGTV